MRPVLQWPDGKKICATFTVAFEAFTRGGHFKKTKGSEVNLVSISHANYGGNAGIWRILEILERNDVRATIDVNGLAVQKWPVYSLKWRACRVRRRHGNSSSNPAQTCFIASMSRTLGFERTKCLRQMIPIGRSMKRDASGISHRSAASSRLRPMPASTPM